MLPLWPRRTLEEELQGLPCKEGNTEAWRSFRLGHIHDRRIQKLLKDEYLDPFDYETYANYEPCLRGKMTNSPFSETGERATELLELIQSDVCGPMSTQAIGGYSYFITFSDDFSRYGHVNLMKYKSETLKKFREYKNEVENQIGNSIKTLRSDRGGEYLSTEFTHFLRDNVILSQWTPPCTPQLNGVSERRNRTLLDIVMSMMSFADLPVSIWGYTLETAAYLLNRVPLKSVVSTPYEIWKGKKPDLKIVKMWSCPAHIRRHNPDKTKDLLLVYEGGSLQVEGYTDLSFQFDIDDSKSNSGYVLTLNGGAVSWKSSKQDTTTDSTIEAEYIVAVEVAEKGVWMKKFIKDLGVIPSSVELTPIYCDSDRVITLAWEPRSHQFSSI
ncbi:hypothetical protein OPV22_014037 [Ensete ventricosum]|uniref:Integrase catalytic domain-containing protein n=1 Tax=Ensete ventricosum TaxID=4639 RepID=A0AAV8RB20_ENSVE|nr:hypothetical protein OPV22_014037 [Ensete ventricosum]